jgi:outer membrane protein assembly factor BamD
MLNSKIFSRISRGTFLVFFCIVFLSGCSWFDFWSKKEPARITPEGLYQSGVELYQKGKYERSIEKFQRLKEEYPLSKFAILAELGIADSFFSDDKYIEAEAAYTDFLNLHPTNVNLPYVIYQIGMCHYNQMMSIDRDQTETVRAAKEFEKLIALYPSSQYTFMAEKMLKECKKRLGEHEFYVGRFYFKSKKYKAALKRFETIAREYPNMGLDYKVSYFIHETKRMIDVTEQKEQEEKAKLEREKQQKELKKISEKKS